MPLVPDRILSNQKGYTLQEMSIVIFITSIIVLTMATILVSSRRIYYKSSEELELQREYSIIINLISHSVRQSLSDSCYIYNDYNALNTGYPGLSGTCLHLKMPSGLTRTFYLDQHDFVLIDKNNQQICFTRDLIQNLNFYYGSLADSNQYINFDLTLSNNEDTLSASQMVSFRN